MDVVPIGQPHDEGTVDACDRDPSHVPGLPMFVWHNVKIFLYSIGPVKSHTHVHIWLKSELELISDLCFSRLCSNQCACKDSVYIVNISSLLTVKRIHGVVKCL